MTLLYKLTDINGRTNGGTQWGPGVTHSGTGEGDLCTDGWIHVYTHPLLAVLLNPNHADFTEPRLWEADGIIELDDRDLQVGCRSLTTLREIPAPTVTTEQRVRFGILCAREVCREPHWRSWAESWLSGKDRSEESAIAITVAVIGHAAAAAAYAAAYADANPGTAANFVAHAAEAAATYDAPINLIALAQEACS